MRFMLLSIAAFFAGLVDSMAGGGGLISLPSLLAAGIPPHVALATNKVQSAIGTTFSAWRYLKNGFVHLPIGSTAFAGAFAGSFAGAWTVLRVPADSLQAIIPGLIILVGIITFARKQFGADDHFTKAHFSHYMIALVFAFLLGFYDGFFGPGTGSFLAFGFVLLLKFGFLRATGNAKVANLASNYAAIIAFAIGGHIYLTIAMIMGLSNIAGAWIGAGWAIRGGVKVIKPVFGVALLALLLKLLFFPS